MPERDGGPHGASNGAGGRLLPPMSSRTPASSRLLRICRCVVGTCRPRAAARHLSRWRCRRRGGQHPRSFHDPLAAPAGDAQHVVLDLRQLSLSHPNAVSGARVLQQRFPIFGRKCFVWSRSMDRRPPGLAGQFFHLFGCRHAPARGSVGHASIRTYQERMSSPSWL